jgi:hypothetical protein
MSIRPDSQAVDEGPQGQSPMVKRWQGTAPH